MDTTNYCTSCTQQTKHTILFSKQESSNRHDDYHWEETYEIIECNGCANKQFRKTYTDESMVAYTDDYDFNYYNNTCYPNYLIGHRLLSNTYIIPERIRKVYSETLEAFKAKCHLLAGVGFRAVIEAICLEETIPGRNLEQKISNLLRNKMITEKEAARLHSIRFLGNDSVHEMEIPSEKKLYIALEIVEHLLKNLYLIDQDAKSELDTIITNFTEFKELLFKNMMKINAGEEKSLKEILNKSYRRLEPTLIQTFTTSLITEITSGNLNWLSVGTLKPSSLETQNVQHFLKPLPVPPPSAPNPV